MENKEKKMWLVPVIIAVVCMFIVGVAVILFVRGNTPKTIPVVDEGSEIQNSEPGEEPVPDFPLERVGDRNAPIMIEDYLYAYSDLDGNGEVDINDIDRGLRTELCDRIFWDNGSSILDGNFGITKPEDFDGRLEVKDTNSTIKAKDISGEEVELKKFIYSIQLGFDEGGNDVTAGGEG